jgi:hypothetical protein
MVLSVYLPPPDPADRPSWCVGAPFFGAWAQEFWLQPFFVGFQVFEHDDFPAMRIISKVLEDLGKTRHRGNGLIITPEVTIGLLNNPISKHVE